MKITYIGHSCFVVENNAGGKIATDPYKKGSVPGLAAPDIEADEVICSHGHSDHNAFDEVSAPAEPWGGDFKIFSIKTYHDNMKGILRGRNNISRFEVDGLKIVHMGDIGCDLTDTQLDEIKGCDVLMIPVGGFFTINARQAYEMINLIEPRAVIPMHYRGDSFGYVQIGRREDFEKLFEDGDREIVSAGSVAEKLPEGKSLILMDPLRKM